MYPERPNNQWNTCESTIRIVVMASTLDLVGFFFFHTNVSSSRVRSLPPLQSWPQDFSIGNEAARVRQSRDKLIPLKRDGRTRVERALLSYSWLVVYFHIVKK